MVSKIFYLSFISISNGLHIMFARLVNGIRTLIIEAAHILWNSVDKNENYGHTLEPIFVRIIECDHANMTSDMIYKIYSHSQNNVIRPYRSVALHTCIDDTPYTTQFN